MNLLEGHRAAVTGGGSGIGRAIALGYAEQGAEVIVIDIDGEAAGAVRDEIADAGRAAHAVTLDVRDRAACAKAAADIEGSVGPISILVNNAGINRRNPVTGDAETVAGDWDDIMRVNLDGVFNVTRAFLDQLRARRGRVVNIGSIQSFLHVRTPNSIAYTTSKHGVLGFTRALAAELGKDGVQGQRRRPRADRDPAERRRAGAQPGARPALPRPHAARAHRQAGGHRRPRDLPRLRPRRLRHRRHRHGGRGVPGDLKHFSALCAHDGPPSPGPSRERKGRRRG